MDPNNHQSISLFELNNRIRRVIESGFPELYWIVAEISEIHVNPKSGHAYLELVEKARDKDTLIARARATIWAAAYRSLKAYFETTTGQILTTGIKIRARISVDYHELYQFSLNIRDIDPSYTMGDLARRRREIIRQLEEDGVIDMNREIEFPRVPQRIAIISSPTAAGYGDFINQLDHNTPGYHFYTKLFPAIMQGNEAVSSLLHAFDRISGYLNFFDVVVVIRGGGSKTDLTVFDHYDLGFYAAQFPLPVITGIGHERDDSILDLVAHTRCKTPTAAADLLIDHIGEFEDWIMEQSEAITDLAREMIKSHQQFFDRVLQRMPRQVQQKIELSRRQLVRFGQQALSNSHVILVRGNDQLANFSGQLSKNIRRLITDALRYNDSLDRQLRLYDPAHILKRGYSITYHKGKPLKDSQNVKAGDSVTIRLFRGILNGIIHLPEQPDSSSTLNKNSKDHDNIS